MIAQSTIAPVGLIVPISVIRHEGKQTNISETESTPHESQKGDTRITGIDSSATINRDLRGASTESPFGLPTYAISEVYGAHLCEQSKVMLQLDAYQ